MELSNIIYKSKEMELSECGGTDLQSQHSRVSAEGGMVRGQDQPRLYNKSLPQNKNHGEVIRWIMETWGSDEMNYDMCMKMELCDCSHEELQKH